MQRSKEEIAADLVWRYVEQIRELERSDGSAPFTQDELHQLAETLYTASLVPDALCAEQEAACRESVRRRLEAELQGAPRGAATASTEAVSPPQPRRPAVVPAWRFAGATAMAAALAVAVGTVNLWHRPQPVVQVKQVPVPAQAPDVQWMEEAEVHRMLPRLVRNELPPREEKNLMWHMLVCPGCFEHYTELRSGQDQRAERPRVRLAGW